MCQVMVIFNMSSAKVCSSDITETYFSDERVIWVAVTDYYIYSYLIVLLLFRVREVPLKYGVQQTT